MRASISALLLNEIILPEHGVDSNRANRLSASDKPPSTDTQLPNVEPFLSRLIIIREHRRRMAEKIPSFLEGLA